MVEAASERALRHAVQEHRWTATARERTVRFQLALNAALSAAALGLLKIEGPFFADAIAAALFACGFLSCMLGIRAVRDADAALARAATARSVAEEASATPVAVPGSRGVVVVLACFAAFNLASAVTTVWLTYVTPPETYGGGADTLAAICRSARVC